MTRAYPPDICSAETMAYLLDISVTQFRRYIAKGLLPAGTRVDPDTIDSSTASTRWDRQAVLDRWRDVCNADAQEPKGPKGVAGHVPEFIKNGPKTSRRHGRAA